VAFEGRNLADPSQRREELGQRKDRQREERKRRPIERFLMAVRSRESCSQRPEPISGQATVDGLSQQIGER